LKAGARVLGIPERELIRRRAPLPTWRARPCPDHRRREAWLDDHCYLNMDLFKEHKKEALRQTACVAQAHQVMGDPSPPPSLTRCVAE
jgi:hypothetical protein